MTVATCVLNLGLKSMRAAVFDTDRHAVWPSPTARSRAGWAKAGSSRTRRTGGARRSRRWTSPRRPRAGRHGSAGSPTTTSAGCLVAMDEAGDPLRTGIMISDVRAPRTQAERISREPAFRRSGVLGGRVTPDLMLPKIVWLREHEPEHFERARWFASPNDFLVHRLTGEVVTDPAERHQVPARPERGLPAGAPRRARHPGRQRCRRSWPARDAVLPLRRALRERYGLPATTCGSCSRRTTPSAPSTAPGSPRSATPAMSPARSRASGP